MDVVGGIIVLFIFLLSVFLFYKPFTEINNDIQAEPEFSTLTKDTVDNVHTRYPAIFDGGFIFIFAFLLIIALVTSFFLDANPIFFIISIVLLVICLVFGAFLSNVYQELMSDEELTTLTSVFPLTNWVMSNIIIIMVVEFILIGLVVYGKTQLVI